MIKGILIFSALIAVSFASSLQYGFYQRDFSTVLSSCKSVQKNAAQFTGTCYLQLNLLAGRFDTVKAKVLSQKDDMTVKSLLKVAFENSTQYFQAEHPNYGTEYTNFENRIIAIFNKIEPSTSNVQMSEFKAAVLDSKMDEVYTNIITAATQSCGQDNTVCEKTSQLLNLDESTLGSLTIDEFLTKSFENILKSYETIYSDAAAFQSDKQIVSIMLQGLKTKGTAGTLVKAVKDFFASALFMNIRNSYDPTYTTRLPTRVRSTSTKITKSTKEPVVKTKPPQYISMAVYLTVPLMILFLGIVATALVIVFYYRFNPHVGGNKLKVTISDANAPPPPYSEKREVSKF